MKLIFCLTGMLIFGILLSGCQIQPENTETILIEETAVSGEVIEFPEEEQTIEAPEEPKTLSIVMAGDILLHTPVQKAALQKDGSYCYDAVFENLREDIQSADLAIVNQEIILGGEELGVSGYPTFNASHSAGDALVNAGFDVVCHGTNHALDKGKKGLLNCIEFWRETYPEIAVLGIHDSEESADRLYVYENDGFKIAVLNYTYGTNGIPLPKDMPYAVDLLEKEKVAKDLQRAEMLADFTIVCPHWGTEYQLTESSVQKEWVKLFAENGADLVLGTHPHVIQPVEWYEDMLVYYSLGNFVNWTSQSGKGIANRMVGAMAEVTLTFEEDEIIISEYDAEPIICHLEKGTNGVTVYKLSDYTEELAQRNAICAQDSSFSLEYCQKLVDQVFGE